MEAGDWLVPPSSPDPGIPFLEKPPLKFWIVAAPIRAGLLPHNEFGLRFWDAVFGGAAFLYVFWIGRRMSGGLGGAVASFILFMHAPLVFAHGLRSNNMEASVLLCYCGGIAHYMAWASATDPPRRRFHLIAVALFFVLGFMTKFVAALFLPLILVLSTLLIAARRHAFVRDFRLWAGAAALAGALIAPWFVYAQVQFGGQLWRTILGQSVYVRFTTGLAPEHLHPWNFYFVTMYEAFAESHTAWFVGAGLGLILIQTVWRRWADGVVILVWAIVPLCLISLGSSKLYHYAYPFLPPFAIAGGVLVWRLFAIARKPLEWIARSIETPLATGLRRLLPVLERPLVHASLVVLTLGFFAVAVASYVSGPFHLNWGGLVIRNSSVLRPLLFAVAGALLSRTFRFAGPIVALAIVVFLLPRDLYAVEIAHLSQDPHPMRSVRDCLLDLQARSPLPRGIFVELPARSLWHPLNYYFFSVRPWMRPDWAPPAGLAAYMYDPVEMRPALVEVASYEAFLRSRAQLGTDARRDPFAAKIMENVMLLLPRPYAACAVALVEAAPGS